MYDLYGVGGVKNVLCLRLFASSLYEISNGSKDAQKLMITIFGDRLVQKIAHSDLKIYESIRETVQYIAWKIRKCQILIFRRTSENHGWQSVRDILIKILGNGDSARDDLIAGMSSMILRDIYHCHVTETSFLEEGSLLSKNCFKYVFRVAFLLFNDSIGEYILGRKEKLCYEMLASRLVYFYTRLAADTWRILVVRNGPKVETEWYMMRGVQLRDEIPASSNQDSKLTQLQKNNNNDPISQQRPQLSFGTQKTIQRA